MTMTTTLKAHFNNTNRRQQWDDSPVGNLDLNRDEPGCLGYAWDGYQPALALRGQVAEILDPQPGKQVILE